jgi:pilus assembly protein Flp/PilA
MWSSSSGFSVRERRAGVPDHSSPAGISNPLAIAIHNVTFAWSLVSHARAVAMAGSAFTIIKGLAHMMPRSVPRRTTMFATIAKLLKNEDGATAIEYGLIAALIAVAAVTVMGTVGTNLSTTFNTIATKL